MHAEAGDEIVVRGPHVGEEDRKGMITEVHEERGAPPYPVRWENGHDSVFTPSSDTVVEHRPAKGPPAERWAVGRGRSAIARPATANSA
jgi:Domain of unknown function (DUF1918)